MPQNISEAQTRKNYIDGLLVKVGWNIDNRSEVVTEYKITAEPNMISEQQPADSDGFVDYMLFDRHQKPLAIIEAKRTSRDPIAGKQQAEEYATGIKNKYGTAPFIFLTNGYEIWFWNKEKAGPLMVYGLFSRDDLERIRFQNQNNQSLLTTSINPSIIDRDYQLEAVKRVTEGFKNNRRKFLLVMATGTGKTRTAMGLIDILLRSNNAQRVLFLTDREALAVQASDAYKKYLPEQPRQYIRSGEIDPAASLYVTTIQTMNGCFNKVSPGYFDLIISDECHRSIYNKWKDVLSYFHGIQIGLTATPSDFIDRDTFKYFECFDDAPTFHYDYEQAVKDGHLVDFNPPYSARTNFQIQGIKGRELPEAVRNILIEAGLEPDQIDFEGTDLERKVTNAGTNEALIREFMDVCIKDDAGVMPGKSIIFAISHQHAKRLWEIFNRLYPEYKGKLAEIIDSKMERPLSLIDKFKNNSNLRVAISVDMLDTGIDVREIVNLVFAKPIFSKIKFWQMIGRGTRILEKDENLRKPWCTYKNRFLIIDHWNNFEYFGMNPQGEPPNQQEALPVKIFRIRLQKFNWFLNNKEEDRAKALKEELMQDIKLFPENSVAIKENRRNIEKALGDDIWRNHNKSNHDFLDITIAPLFRFKNQVDYHQEGFIYKTEKLGLAVLQKDQPQIERLKEEILSDISHLPMNLEAVKAKEPVIRQITSAAFWANLNYEKSLFIRDALWDIIRFWQVEERNILRLDLSDLVVNRKWIEFGPEGQGDYVANYREKVEQKIIELAGQHPVIKKIKAGLPVNDRDIENLEKTLNGPELYITEENLRKSFEQPYGTLVQFVKSILGHYRFPNSLELVQQSFDTYVKERDAQNPLSADQVRFLRTIKNVFAEKKHIEYSDLFEPPFTMFGSEAALRLFTENELKDIVNIFNKAGEPGNLAGKNK